MDIRSWFTSTPFPPSCRGSLFSCSTKSTKVAKRPEVTEPQTPGEHRLAQLAEPEKDVAAGTRTPAGGPHPPRPRPHRAAPRPRARRRAQRGDPEKHVAAATRTLVVGPYLSRRRQPRSEAIRALDENPRPPEARLDEAAGLAGARALQRSGERR